MAKTSFETDLVVENLKEFQHALKRFGPELAHGMYPSLQRTAFKFEGILKGDAPYKTGRLQRSTYCIATFRPLGLEMGALAEYAYWTEKPHGTWPGGWFSRAFNRNIHILIEGIERALERGIKTYQKKVKN